MTTAGSVAPTTGWWSDAVGSSAADGSDRGTTTLADRVVEKIAGRAAQEVPGCLALDHRVAGFRTRRPSVIAQAVTDGSITGLSIAVGIAYPSPITSTTRQIRAHVRQQVELLCGLRVDHVDIDVAQVSRPEVADRRVR